MATIRHRQKNPVTVGVKKIFILCRLLTPAQICSMIAENHYDCRRVNRTDRDDIPLDDFSGKHGLSQELFAIGNELAF